MFDKEIKAAPASFKNLMEHIHLHARIPVVLALQLSTETTAELQW